MGNPVTVLTFERADGQRNFKRLLRVLNYSACNISQKKNTYQCQRAEENHDDDRCLKVLVLDKPRMANLLS